MTDHFLSDILMTITRTHLIMCNNGHGLKTVTCKQMFKSRCLRDGEETPRERLKGNVPNGLGKLDVFSFCVLNGHEMKGNMIQLGHFQTTGKTERKVQHLIQCEINYENKVNNFLKRLFSRTFVKFPRSRPEDDFA